MINDVGPGKFATAGPNAKPGSLNGVVTISGFVRDAGRESSLTFETNQKLTRIAVFGIKGSHPSKIEIQMYDPSGSSSFINTGFYNRYNGFRNGSSIIRPSFP